MTHPATRAVIEALADSGRRVMFVGGCVRDAVLGKAIKDIDIATPDPPDRVTALLVAAGIKTVPTGIDHGTVTAVTRGRHFEITTLRRDVETYGRRAKVAFTDDWAADAARRDFTMNALYLAPDGALYDPTGGLADLKAGRVRFIGTAAARIAEDYLRILRFFRFTAWYGKAPPRAADLAACRRLAPRMDRLAAERIAGELLKLLAVPAPAPVVRQMAEAGVLAVVLPEACDFDRLERLCRIDRATPAATRSLRRLAALLPDRAEVGVAVAGRLRLSNAERDRLVAALTTPGVAENASIGRLEALAYRAGAEAVVDRLLLAHAARPVVAGSRLKAQLAALRRWRRPSFPIKGGDLIARGLPRGPEIGRLMTVLEDWWIENDFGPGRDALLGRLDALVQPER
ncbi:MAG: CCA tRNA nucleotidyltransferase [Alphaproteobacteria bacterium]|nr:CCA tRNA nucleotidyltransferase [Alphaproteobacteria bacterium]